MQKLMGDEGWGGLFFSTDPKCLCIRQVLVRHLKMILGLKNMFVISPHLLTKGWEGGQQFIRIQSHIYLGTPAVLIFSLGKQ